MAQEFPDHEKLIFKPEFDKDETRDFVGSIQKEVIRDISNLQCAGCEKFLITENENTPPKTGYCGHIFCSKCANKLYGKINELRSTGGPRIIDTEMFEIYCEDIPEFSLYKCKICKSVVRKLEERNHKIRLFSDNIMLRDLYKALKCSHGYRCEDCERGFTFHPKFNSLHCATCSEEKKRKQYVCVWDIDKHRGHDLEIMKEEDEEHKEHHSHGLDLSSLDRKTRKVFAALYHCACCSTSLEKDGSNTQHRHLECGHFIGARCVEKARKKMVERKEAGMAAYLKRKREKKLYDATDLLKDEGSVGRGIFCIFCKNDPVKKSDLNVYPVFPPGQHRLTESIFANPYSLIECTFDCEKCNFKACKTLFCLWNDQLNGRCQWCKVQHLLNRGDGCDDSD